MKKYIILTATLLLLSVSALAMDTTFMLKGNYFGPTEKEFKEIYGGGLMYGGEVNVGIMKNIVVWAGGNYFTKRGELTFTQETTTLSLLPLGVGVKFRVKAGALHLYAGGGIRHYNFKESNEPMGVAKKGRIGYMGTIGGIIRVARKWVIDLYVNYSYCRMTPAFFTVNIGGIEAGIGFGYEFR